MKFKWLDTTELFIIFLLLLKKQQTVKPASTSLLTVMHTEILFTLSFISSPLYHEQNTKG